MAIQALVLSGVGSSGGSGALVAGATCTSVTGSETGPVYQDLNQLLHTSVTLVPVFSALPCAGTLWLDIDDGNGWQNQGNTVFSTVGQSVILGQQSGTTPGFPGSGGIWVPVNPAQTNWKVACIAGAVSGNTPPTGFVQSGFTVAAAGACLPTDCTSIQFTANPATSDIIDYVVADPGTYQWSFHELSWVQPTTVYDPSYAYSIVTVQKGYSTTGTVTITGGVNAEATAAIFSATSVGNVVHVAGVLNTIVTYIDPTHVVLTTATSNGVGQTFEMFTPAPDAEGVNENASLAYYGRVFDQSGTTDGFPEVAGSTVTLGASMGILGAFPPATNPDGSANLYTTFRVLCYAVSQTGLNPGGSATAYTLQTGWPGGADHFDLSPTPQAAALDLNSTIPAPNITAGTAVASYGLYGNASAALLSGTLTLPAVTTYISKILVVWSRGSNSRPLATLTQPLPTTWSSGPFYTILQDGSAHTDTVSFICENAASAQTASPVTASVTIEASVVTSVSGSEVGPQVIAPGDQVSRLVSTTIGLVPVLGSSQVPQNVTYLVSQDNGATYTYTGWGLVTSVGQTLTVSKISPETTSTWKVAACAGAVGGDPSILIPASSLSSMFPGIVISSGFSVAGLSLPSASAVTSASVGSFQNIVRNDGTQYGQIGSVTYTDPTDLSFFVRVTVQQYNASGSSIAAEQPYSGFQVAGAGGTVRTTLPLDVTYVANLAYIRYRIYLATRTSTGTYDFTNPALTVLQNCWAGGADHFDRAVTMPANWAGGLSNTISTANPNGLPAVNNQNTGTSLLPDWNFGFEALGAATPGPGIGAPGSAWSFGGTAADVVVQNDGGSSTSGVQNYVRITSPGTGVGNFIVTNIPYMPSGQALYFQAAVRSSNTSGANHELLLIVTAYDSSGTIIGSSYTFTCSGYAPAWIQVGISGTVLFPANTSSVQIEIAQNSADTAGATWDVTNVLVQSVQNQTVSGQVNSQVPQAQTIGTSALSSASVSTTASSEYGLQTMELQDASGGEATVNVGSGIGELGLSWDLGGAGQAFATLAAQNGDVTFNIQCLVSGVTTAFGVQVTSAGISITQVGTTFLNGNALLSGATVVTSAGTKNISHGLIEA